MSNELFIEHLLQPETPLEEEIMKHPEWRKGVVWGKPRFGHPEGEVLFHIREVLDNVDKLQLDTLTRRRLRIITLTHDTFKFKEDRGFPRDWSKHHAVYAKNFTRLFTIDKPTLDVIELHDEAFYSWRMIFLRNGKNEGKERFQQLLKRIGEHRQLYYLFFKCDTRTGDKMLDPLYWLERTWKGIEVVDF